MMKDSETRSNTVARFLLDELETEQREALRLEIENDPAAMEQLQQMQATLEALKTWSRRHDSLPPPEIPRTVDKTRRSKRTVLSLALAASVLLALGLGIFFLPDG
jgi:ferric-dicitrate binding protein FerR (iron transport regulator)